MLRDKVDVKQIVIGDITQLQDFISIGYKCGKEFELAFRSKTLKDKKKNLIFAERLAEKIECFAKELADDYEKEVGVNDDEA